MAKNLSNLILTDTDQQKSNFDKNAHLEDYYRSETINNFHLTVVADGGGESAPEHAAKLAVETIFTKFSRAIEKNPIDTLRNSLLAANEAVFRDGQKDYVGVTVLAIKENHIYIGQAGALTCAYLAHDYKKTLTKQTENCLGDLPSLPDLYVDKIKEPIKQGDRIVICSDGLFDPPEIQDQEKFNKKIDSESHAVSQYDDIIGAARHLSSIAKGMDVSDDITVVVLGIGRKPNKVSRNILAISAVIALLLLITTIFFTVPQQKPPRPPDLGMALLVSGNANRVDAQTNSLVAIEQYSLIEPGTRIVTPPKSSIDLRLKRTDIQGTKTESIPGVDLYLSEQSEIILTTIDLASSMEGQSTDPSLLNLSEITLVRGKLLIVSDGSRKYVALVPVNDKDKNLQISLSFGGRGALGVVRQGPSVQIYCLLGICEFVSPNGEMMALFTPGKSSLDIDNPSQLSASEPVLESDLIMWNALCNGNQPNNCELSK